MSTRKPTVYASRPVPTGPLVARILVILGFALVVRAVLQTHLIDLGASSRHAADLSYLAVPVLLSAMLWPVLKQHRTFLAELFDPARLSWRLVANAVLVGVLLRLAFWGKLLGLLAFAGGTDEGNRPTVDRFVGRPVDPIVDSHADSLADMPADPLIGFACPPVATVALYALATVLLAPVIEEVINRGFFLHRLLRSGKAAAVTASSGLFAVFHPLATMDAAFVTGVALAVLTLRTCSLWPAILAHGTFNALIVLDWLCLKVTWNPAPVTPATLRIGVAAILVCVAAIAAAAFLILKSVPGQNPGTGTARARSPRAR